MTKEEYDAFVISEDIVLKDIDRDSSIKTNIYYAAKNIVGIGKYMTKLKSAIIYVNNLISIDNIIKTVVSTFESSKNCLVLPTDSMVISYNNVLITNGVSYNVIKTGATTLEITKKDALTWDVDNLLIQIKSTNGTVINPSINTANNKIIITIVGMSGTYRLLFI